MALKCDDHLETGTSFRTMFGGNGDYYIEMWWIDENGLNHNKCVRVRMSGGEAPTEVKIAMAKLHWAMEESGFNEYPDE